MGDDTPGFDIRQTPVDISQELQIFEQGLITLDVNKNRRALSLLGQDDRAPRFLDLPEQILRPDSKVGGRMDVLGHVEQDSWHQSLRRLPRIARLRSGGEVPPLHRRPHRPNILVERSVGEHGTGELADREVGAAGSLAELGGDGGTVIGPGPLGKIP